MSLTEWLKRNTPTGSVVTGHLDPILYLYSDRLAVRPYASNLSRLFYGVPAAADPVGSVEDFRTNLLRYRVTYIAITPARLFRESDPFMQLLAKAMRQYPKAFSIAYRLPDPEYSILAVNPGAL